MLKRWHFSLLLLLSLAVLPLVVAAQIDDQTDMAGVQVIVNPETPFLLIYAEPGETAPVSEAVSGGVTLILTGETETVDGLVWWQVIPPSRITGWILEIVEGTPTLLLSDGTPLGKSDEPNSGAMGEPVRTVIAPQSIDNTAVVVVDLLLIHGEPDTESSAVEAVVRDVALEILTLPDSSVDGNWMRVRSPSGVEGWVQTLVDDFPTLISGVAAGGELTVGVQALVGGQSTLLLIREEAGANAQVIEAALSGVSLLIVGGPTLVEDTTWWQVRSARSIEGWVPEVLDGEIMLLSPNAQAQLVPTPTATPLPTPTTVPIFTEIGVGAEVQIVSLEPSFPLRGDPSMRASVVTNLERSEQATIIGGPQAVSEVSPRGVAEDFSWWQIRTANRVEGWIQEDFYGEPVLVLFSPLDPIQPVQCTLSTIRDVNIRSGPGTQYDQVASRAGEGQILAADGQFGDINTPEAHWWRLYQGFWIRDDQVRELTRESCAELPVVSS